MNQAPTAAVNPFDVGAEDYLWIAQHAAVMGAGERLRGYWRRNQEIMAAAVARGRFSAQELNELRTMRVEMGG